MGLCDVHVARPAGWRKVPWLTWLLPRDLKEMIKIVMHWTMLLHDFIGSFGYFSDLLDLSVFQDLFPECAARVPVSPGGLRVAVTSATVRACPRLSA